MRDLFIVASYTIKEMIKRKSFIISTIIILLIIIIGTNVPNILNAINGDKEGEMFSDKVLIVDGNNLFENSLASLNQMELGYTFLIENKNISFEEVKNKINNEEVDSAIIISSRDNLINLEYVVKNIGMMNHVPESLINGLSTTYSNLQLSKLNLTQNQLQSLTPNFNFDIKQVDDKEISGNLLTIMLLSIVLFYAIYFCAYQVSSSITTEKTSRIMETLLTSTKPRTIVLGKTLGIGVVGLLQVILIVAVGLISVNTFMDSELVKQIIDMSQITVGLGLVTIVYFILGYTLYALLYALTGSTVSKPEDIQSANGPVAILAVIGFYLAYFTMMNPTSNLNLFASIFPISSPFCMPFRVMMGIATVPEIIISLVVLLITSLIIAKIAIKIYSQSVFNYGNKMNFKDMFKLYKQKD